MSKQEDGQLNAAEGAGEETRENGNSTTRADESGDVAEANAPTGVEENDGMNTILGGGAGTGVQPDASDE